MPAPARMWRPVCHFLRNTIEEQLASVRHGIAARVGGSCAYRRLSALALATLVALIGTAGKPVIADVTPTNVTYLKDIAPIFARRCLGCHMSPAGGTIPLDTIDRVRESAVPIRRAVLEKRMPPWPAAAGFNQFSNDTSLTAAETEVIRSWLDGKMPLGVAVTAVPGSTPGRAALSRPGLSIPLDAHSRDPIAGHRFVVRSPAGATRWMSGWAIRPASAAIREIRVEIDGQDAGTLVLPETRLDFPRGIARRVPPGASITIDVRYASERTDDASSGSIDIFFTPRPSVELEHRELACGRNVLDRDVEIVALTPHAIRAARLEIAARRPDGSVQALIVIPKFAPDYRYRYAFSAPVSLPRGTVIDLRSSDSTCSAGADVSGLPAPRAR